MPPRDAPWPPPLQHEETTVSDEVAASERDQTVGHEPAHHRQSSTAAAGTSGGRYSSDGRARARGPPSQSIQGQVVSSDGELGPADEEEPEWSGDDDGGTEQGLTRPGKRTFDALQLHPNGVANWMHTPNCMACLEYKCPCQDGACLAKVKNHHGHGALTAIYEFRKLFRTRVQQGSLGKTDTLHMDLQAHYDETTRSFTRGFVVAGVGGLCEKAYSVALGLSEASIARARADVTRGRGLRKAHRAERIRRVCLARSKLDAWVLAQQDTFEGDKYNGKKWYTEKTTEPALWKKYTAECSRLNQPSVGTSRLLHTIWKEHLEIKEVAPTGHDICDVCGELRSKRVQLDGLSGAEATRMRTSIDEHRRLLTMPSTAESARSTTAQSPMRLCGVQPCRLPS